MNYSSQHNDKLMVVGVTSNIKNQRTGEERHNSTMSVLSTKNLRLLVATLLLHAAFVSGFQHATTTSYSLRIPAKAQGRFSSHAAGSQRRLSMALDASSATSSEETSKPPFPLVLWRFTRPHTIIGSALAIPSLHLLAAPSYAAGFSIRSLLSMVYAMIPALFMNLYITGLNQVTDVEIDKINKPNLPIAKGDLSLKRGIVTVIISLILSLLMGVAHPVFGSEGLNVALWFSGILGTMYSLQPFRLKRFPFLAAFCIVSVRGAVINAGFFAHAKAAAFGQSASVLEYLMNDRQCMLSSLYFAIFGVVIALMKDVPDVKGDAMSDVRTFSVRLGQTRVFRLMHRLLTLTFLGVGFKFLKASSDASVLSVKIGRGLVACCSLFASISVQNEAAPVDPEDPKEVYKFYMHLWKLFYLSYLVLPFAR